VSGGILPAVIAAIAEKAVIVPQVRRLRLHVHTMAGSWHEPQPVPGGGPQPDREEEGGREPGQVGTHRCGQVCGHPSGTRQRWEDDELLRGYRPARSKNSLAERTTAEHPDGWESGVGPRELHQ